MTFSIPTVRWMSDSANPLPEPSPRPKLSPLHMHAVTAFFAIWTLLLATLASTLHMLTLGYGDVSMWVARRLWVPPVLAFARIKLDLKGGEELRGDRPYIAVANHQSVLDILVLFLAIPRLPIRFIAKQVLFYIPLFGWYLWLTGYVAVNRGNRSKARKSLVRAASRIAKRNTTIVVFPEGTRTPDGTVKRFKKGAFVLATQCQAPVVPIALAGAYGVMNRHEWHVYPGTIHARVLPPIPSAGHVYEGRDDLASAARQAIIAEVQRLRQEFGLQEMATGALTAAEHTGEAPDEAVRA